MPSETAITKPVLPPLQTPKSASFPSEIVSTPMSAVMSAVMKHDHDLKTPITPPTAYTDFIKALTPIMASPPPSALGRSNSEDSNISQLSSKTSHSSHNGESRSPPTSACLPPPSPRSAGYNNGRNTPTALKRLRIPQYSPVSAFSPATARSPYTTAGSMMYSPFSPADWTGRSNFEFISTPRSACSKPVSVRSVVTRTVTYKRTTPNLEPAPKGKKRKVSSGASSVTSVEDMRQNLREIKREAQPESNLKSEVKMEAEPKAEVAIKIEQVKQEMPPPPAISVSLASSDASDASEP